MHCCALVAGAGLAVARSGQRARRPSADYPDIAAAVGAGSWRGEADAGIVIDGAGSVRRLRPTRSHGVRAAMCTERTLARYAREHNGANVLALGATLVSPTTRSAIVDAFLSTPMREPRYIRRGRKIPAIEDR